MEEMAESTKNYSIEEIEMGMGIPKIVEKEITWDYLSDAQLNEIIDIIK